MTISPWDSTCELESPNKKHKAVFGDGHEIAMGAPIWGEIKINTELDFNACNGSMVWSDDSRYLAIPSWTPRRNQRLMVVDMETKGVFLSKKEFRVLQLESFINGVIEGIDSPIYKPEKIRMELKDLDLT